MSAAPPDWYEVPNSPGVYAYWDGVAWAPVVPGAMPGTLPPPGTYPYNSDPADPRYWDGTSWYVAAPPPPYFPPPPAFEPAPPSFAPPPPPASESTPLPPPSFSSPPPYSPLAFEPAPPSSFAPPLPPPPFRRRLPTLRLRPPLSPHHPRRRFRRRLDSSPHRSSRPPLSLRRLLFAPSHAAWCSLLSPYSPWASEASSCMDRSGTPPPRALGRSRRCLNGAPCSHGPLPRRPELRTRLPWDPRPPISCLRSPSFVRTPPTSSGSPASSPPRPPRPLLSTSTGIWLAPRPA